MSTKNTSVSKKIKIKTINVFEIIERIFLTVYTNLIWHEW